MRVKMESLIYSPPQSGIDSAHFFDSESHVEEQFIFVPKADLESLIKDIPCKWERKSELQYLGQLCWND